MISLGLRPQEIRLVGGGSKNRLWRQIVADVFQLPVLMPLEPESAALGAALQVRGSLLWLHPAANNPRHTAFYVLTLFTCSLG